MTTPTLTEGGEQQALMNNDDNNESAFLKASPRPWRVHCSNEVFGDGEGGESFSEWVNVIDPDGKVICELPGHSQYARASEMCKIEDANAALIVQAVNERPALLAQAAHHSAQLEKSLGRIKELEGALQESTDMLMRAVAHVPANLVKTPDAYSKPVDECRWTGLMWQTIESCRALLHPDSTKKS